MENNLGDEKKKINDNEPLFIEKDHKGLKWFIIIAILLLILGGLSIFYYFKIYNNPKLVIGNILKDVKEEFKFEDTTELETFKFSGELDIDLGFADTSLQNIAEIINNIKLQYILSCDGDDYSALEIFTKYKNESLLNAKMILEMKENLGYLYLDNLYDKYLKFKLDNNNNNNHFESNVDYEILVNGVFDALSKSITKDDFERDEDKTSINGSIKEVYRNSFVINRGNYQRIMKTFITELRNNEQFINEIGKINKDNDFKEELNTMLEEIDKEIFEDVIKINFYTKRSLKQELLKLEIVQNSEDGDINISITSNNDNKITIDIVDSDDNKITMDIKINSDTNFLINFNFENGDDYVKIHLNSSIQELDKLDRIETKPSIDGEKLTEDDQNKIMTNLSQNETLLKLLNDVMNIFSPTM